MSLVTYDFSEISVRHYNPLESFSNFSDLYKYNDFSDFCDVNDISAKEDLSH